MTPPESSQQVITPGHHHHLKRPYLEVETDYSPTFAEPYTGAGSLRAEALAIIAELIVITCALVALAMGMISLQPEIGDLGINFVAIILEAMPFMMIGAVIGGIIEVFVPAEFVQGALAGRATTTVFIAGALGIIFPVCECAILPLVRRLINKGVPRPAVIAFLLGAPIVNPLVAASTWLAYRGNWGVVTTRMICGYVIAVSVAFVFDALFPREKLAPVMSDVSCEHGCHHCDCDHDHTHVPSGFLAKMSDVVTHAREDFFTVGKFLIIGAFVAALARATIDVVAFRELFASPILSILAMMGLAISLNLCSETDAFIAAGFRGIFPDTAQMAFMVLGPMLDLKLILGYFTIFRGRIIWSLAFMTVVAVLITMMVLHYGFGGVPGGH